MVFTGDPTKTAMVLALKRTLCLLGSVIPDTFLFPFNAKNSTELRGKKKKIKWGGGKDSLNTKCYGWQTPGLKQNCVCEFVNGLSSYLLNPNDPSRVDRGLGGYFLLLFSKQNHFRRKKSVAPWTILKVTSY